MVTVIVDVEGAVRVLRDAKKLLILVGSRLDGDILSTVVKLAEGLGAKAGIAATGNTAAPLREMGIDAGKEWTAEVVSRMLHSEGDKPDLLVFVGFYSFVLSGVLSTLKHFASCKTLALERRRFENADFSLSEMSKEAWRDALMRIAEGVIR
ncbi:MAG: hypothetical protein DRN91_01560 [Candidatus Alkanophagales archaeon]|nr:MAG: hypothetical protein DRN91_01560 [Candidatus Alkanophagales archaeon]